MLGTSTRTAARRRGHKKSRHGCRSCKQHRVKCDEFRPEWYAARSSESAVLKVNNDSRNCISRGWHCDYLNGRPAGGSNFQYLPLQWTEEVETGCKVWQDTGVPPFPALRLPRSLSWHSFESNDYRHLYHVGLISSSLELSSMGRSSLWGCQLPKCVPYLATDSSCYFMLSNSRSFLRMASSFDFLAYALMALSASRLAWITKSTEADNAACYYQNLAFRGLRPAVQYFSQENSDAVLAASILLSVQCHEWCVQILLRVLGT